jgi:hypothetical protein
LPPNLVAARVDQTDKPDRLKIGRWSGWGNATKQY